MIPIKYALLLFLLCSVVVSTGNSGTGKRKRKDENHNTVNKRNQIDEKVNDHIEEKDWKFHSDEIIARNRDYIKKKENEKHPDGTARRISLDELNTLKSKIPNPKTISHWPPSEWIGGIYVTEPFNFGQPLAHRAGAELPHYVVVLGGEDLVNLLVEKEKLTGTLMSEAELKNKKINRVVVVEMSTRLRGATIKQPVQDFFPDDDRKNSFLNVGRARLVEATEFVLMPAPIEKWKQMKSDKANELKQKIIESKFEMTFPAWMIKEKFDSREDLVSFLYRRPRVALLESLEGNVEEESNQSY